MVVLLALSELVKVINTLNALALVETARDEWQQPWAVIDSLKLRQGEVVADIGAGAGYFSLKLSTVVGSSGKVLAEDIQKLPMAFLWIRAVSQGKRNISISLGDPTDPHLPRLGIDAVLIANTYHEFADPEVILEHIVKALRPGGRLVVLDRSADAEHHEIAPHIVAAQLQRHGFDVRSIRDHFIDRPNGEVWWLIAAEKRASSTGQRSACPCERFRYAWHKYSTIGPSARAGRKHRAPDSKIVPNTIAPNVGVSSGSVPFVTGSRRCKANRPARASASAARAYRPASIAISVVML
jgi:ubiquinone/menaquinone biosynthesis C-methylase UbiE